MGGVGAVHGPADGGPVTRRNPTVREGASASPKGGVERITRQAHVLPPENAAEIVLKHGNELL